MCFKLLHERIANFCCGRDKTEYCIKMSAYQLKYSLLFLQDGMRGIQHGLGTQRQQTGKDYMQQKHQRLVKYQNSGQIWTFSGHFSQNVPSATKFIKTHTFSKKKARLECGSYQWVHWTVLGTIVTSFNPVNILFSPESWDILFFPYFNVRHWFPY